jgi:hypothetical protein
MRTTPTSPDPVQPLPATSTRRTRASWSEILIAALAVLSAVLLVSCTSAPPSPNSEDGNKQRSETTTPRATPVPYLPGSEADAEAYAALRQLDPCALLDPDAGAQAVGGTADQLVPGPDPAECTLDVLPDGAKRSVDAWTVTTTMGVSFDSSDTGLGGATPQPIPGAPNNSYYREESFSETDCTIVRPLDKKYGDGYGIELEVQAPILAETSPQPPCDIAVAYLKATTDRWLEPPARSAGLTEPRLPLTEQDPCAATTAIGEQLGRNVQASPESLYTCRVVFTGPAGDATERADTRPPTSRTPAEPAKPTSPVPTGLRSESSSEESVEVRFTLTGDPASREPSNGIEPVSIAGRVGSVDRSLSAGCVVQVATTDKVTVDTQDGESVQVVGVMAPDCETATQLAATVLENVVDR